MGYQKKIIQKIPEKANKETINILKGKIRDQKRIIKQLNQEIKDLSKRLKLEGLLGEKMDLKEVQAKQEKSKERKQEKKIQKRNQKIKVDEKARRELIDKLKREYCGE